MAAEQSMGQWPWHEGYYRATGCLYDYVLVRGNSGKTTGLEITFQHGHFGKADQEVFELTKQKEYNVELRYMLGEAVGRIQVPVVEHGIISDDGRKITLKNFLGIAVLDWVSQQEAMLIEESKDHLYSLSHPYKDLSKTGGKLLWVTGPPGLGKSTTAQILARRAGYVYYEGDCFFFLKNPFIPLDIAEPSKALRFQRDLRGEELGRRMEVIRNGNTAFWTMQRGENYSREDLESFYSALCEDIARQRERMGGDWVIATVIEKRVWRDFIRLVPFVCRNCYYIMYEGQNSVQTCSLWFLT